MAIRSKTTKKRLAFWFLFSLALTGLGCGSAPAQPVPDVNQKIMESGRSGLPCPMETVCERPAPLENGEELLS